MAYLCYMLYYKKTDARIMGNMNVRIKAKTDSDTDRRATMLSGLVFLS